MERRRRRSWVTLRLLARGGRGHAGTHAPVAQVMLPPGLLLPVAVVLVAGTVAGSWLDAASPCPHQPRGAVSSGSSRMLQRMRGCGAAVPSPPAPMSHRQGWSHLGTVARAARSFPSRGVSSPMAPRGRCFTSPVSARTRVTNCQRVLALRLPAWWSWQGPRPPLGYGDLCLGTDASCCCSSPGTYRGRTDPDNGNTEPRGSRRRCCPWAGEGVLPVKDGRGSTACEHHSTVLWSPVPARQARAGESEKPLTLQTWKVDSDHRKERKSQRE